MNAESTQPTGGGAADDVVLPCQRKKAIEAIFVGEDDQPLAGIRLQLGDGPRAMLSKTAADGSVRFEGLTPGSQYRLSPFELDREAWQLIDTQPIPEPLDSSTNQASWGSAAATPANGSGAVHKVVQGESVDLLAAAHGLFPETVWEHPRNAGLRAKRENRNTLLAGDPLFLPEVQPSDIQVDAGMRYRLKRKGVPSRLRLRLLDDLRPLADMAWTLEIPGAATLTGVTSGDGVLEAWVPPEAPSATLIYRLRETIRETKIVLGDLTPAKEREGWRQRLQNLAFEFGEKPGPEADRGVLLRFQESYGLPLSGEPDAATVAMIRMVHDGAEAKRPESGVYGQKT